MTYTVSHNLTSNILNEENNQIIFTVTSLFPSNGTILNWRNIGSSNARDFLENASSGYVTISGSSANLTLTLKKDKKLEGKEDLIILFSNTITNQVVASSSVISIKDTSFPIDDITVTLPDVAINSSPQNTLLVVNSATANIWVDQDIIGELEMFQTSELSIRNNISNDLNLNLIYEKIGGTLPTGITLLRDGTLQGAALSDTTTITTTTNYSFTVALSKSVGNPISTATFTLVVNRTDSAIYTPVYIKPLLKQETRQFISNFLHNKSIFDPNYLYRPFDKNFGIQKEFKSYLHFAIERVDDFGLQDLSDLFFYKKTFLVGPPKFAIAKDKLGRYIYDAVYSEILDYSLNDQGQSASNIGLTPSEPFTYTNVRKRFELRGFLKGYNTNRFNPRFMQTVQQGSTTELGFIPCVVWAYVLPNKGNLVIDSIKQAELSFNNIHFDIDRFIIERSNISQEHKFFMFGGTAQYS